MTGLTLGTVTVRGLNEAADQLQARPGPTGLWLRNVRFRTEAGPRSRLGYRVLHEFLTLHRDDILARCIKAAAHRTSRLSSEADSLTGVDPFLDQIIATLRLEQTSQRSSSAEISGLSGGGTPSQIGDTATLHGQNALGRGLTIEQVVRDYGDVCQAVTNLACELNAPIDVDEFRTFNRCIDNAIASAISAYALQDAENVERLNVLASNSRIGELVHELRNYLYVLTNAIGAIKSGKVGMSGATGAVLDRSLAGMRAVIDRSVGVVKLTAALPPRIQPIRLAGFVEDVERSASHDPRAERCSLIVEPVASDLMVSADPDMLHAAVYNLLQNAFKFTQPDSIVTLKVHEVGSRVRIEVADHCGGLPPGAEESLLRPFAQNGEDRSGLGLGLGICRRSVAASGGVLRVRNLPGSGCVFTIDLPRL